MEIETILLEPEPVLIMLSLIDRKEPTLDILLSKEEKKINKIAYVNAQISDMNANKVAIFTDGSCIGNQGPTGAGAIIPKNGLNKPAIKIAKAVSNNSTNYHDEVGALKKKNFMASFYGWGSTASRLEPLRGGSLLFTTEFPHII